jgi:hypothetical protein
MMVWAPLHEQRGGKHDVVVVRICQSKGLTSCRATSSSDRENEKFFCLYKVPK